ncbi:transmembrane protein, putative (macronuclear) [Tetrahymena thermophila SB210]|uniref:Transmembrane protein, putative n=1 Tax=Tetrahymena thermophila (strain SB210) TaxID=312017 RepID=Q24FG6_TETTS|nr:transmembrane protein, putative [Tetrahymena thermophila SB210]EAS06492.2 transmembrane protein, putative [Tetrahymena thermophila SB210]|eukprot:XP_001026737.2 transmembrane protein, putative [Tetrahymena thermophila SB210]
MKIIYLNYLSFILLFLCYSEVLSTNNCGIGCSECQSSIQGQYLCSKCEQDFILQNNQCSYTLCQPFTYLVYDKSLSQQNPQQCKAICPDYFQENQILNICQQINQCSISYSTDQTKNRINNGGNVENIIFISKKKTMIVYETYQTIINTNTGSFMSDMIDSNIIKVIQVYPNFVLMTADNQLIYWDYVSNSKQVILKISQGRLSKKSQIVYQSADQYYQVVTSYDEWLNLVYFTSFTLGDASFKSFPQTPSLSLASSFVYILDGYVIQTNVNRTINIYSFVINKNVNQFNLLKRQFSQVNLQVPYSPILQAIYYQIQGQSSINLLIIQQQSLNLIQFTDNSDGQSFPSIDYQILQFTDFPYEVTFLQQIDDEIYSTFAVRFSQQIQFYNQTLQFILAFQQPSITGFAFYRDPTLDYYQVKMFVLYSQLSYVTSHIVSYGTPSITDKSKITIQIQNPISFIKQNIKTILGGRILSQKQNDLKMRNLQFGTTVFSLYIVGKNIQKIDVDADQTSFVVNPFVQKKWVQGDVINQMVYSQISQILLTCSNDGTIIAWNTIESMNPDFLYKVERQLQRCIDIQLYNDQWVVALFSKQILIFGLRNQYEYKEYFFVSTSDQRQFIAHQSLYILLYYDNNFSILDGNTLSQISQNNKLIQNQSIQKIVFLENLSIIIQNSLDSICILQLSQQLLFPSQINFSFKSQYGNIVFLKTDFNINTNYNEIMVCLQNNAFLILNNQLQLIFSHILQQGFPFQVKKYSDRNTYILFGQVSNQDAAYQYFHYILYRDTNQGNIIGKSYSLKFNLGINIALDYKGNSQINYLSSQPQTFYTIIQRNRYLQNIQSLEFSHFVFSYGPGITQYVNSNSGNVQYYSGADGTLSFDTNNLNSVQQILLNPQNSKEAILNLQTSIKLGLLFIVQKEINIYNIQPIQQLVISENQSRIFCFKQQQVIMQNFNDNTKKEYSTQGYVNGIILNEEQQLVYIYGSQFLVTDFDLKIQQTVFDGQIQRYQLAYDFQGNLQSSYNNFGSFVKDLQIFGQNVAVLVNSNIYLFLRGSLLFQQYITPNGGGNLLGYYYIQDYNLLVYYTDNIRNAQLFYFNLETQSDDGYTSSPYTEIGYGKVVQLFYDPLAQRLNYIDSLGYLYSISLNSQKAFSNLIPFDAFQELGKPTNYYIDYNVNNLYVYNSQAIFFINYNLVSKYVIQQSQLNQQYYIKMIQGNSQLNTLYFIFDALSTLYIYKNLVSTYLCYFNEEVVDVKQLNQYQLIILVFSSKMLIYTYDQTQNLSLLSDTYVGVINNPQISKFLSDELYISTSNQLIHINYKFYLDSNSNWQYKSIQYPKDDQVISSIKLDGQEKQILISFKSGNVILYDQTLKSVKNIITQKSNSLQANLLSYTQNLIFLVFSDGSITKISRQDSTDQKNYNMQQVLQAQQNKFCSITVDAQYNQIFLNFCFTKIIYVLDTNTLQLAKYLSFPNDQHNRIYLSNNFMFAYSWSQVNIFKRGTLEFLNNIRKNNSYERILSLQVINESILIISLNQALEIYLMVQNKILLIEQQEFLNPHIIDVFLSKSDNSLLSIIGVSDQTIFEKRINLNLFDISMKLNNFNNQQISTLIQSNYYSCFYQIDMTNRDVAQNIFFNIYDSSQTNKNYRISAGVRGEIQALSFIPSSASVNIIFEPSETKQENQYVVIGSDTYTQYGFQNINFKDLTMNFGYIQQQMTFSNFTQNVNWQDIRIHDLNYGQVQIHFSNMNNVVISNLTITNIDYNQKYFQTYQDKFTKESQIFFYFQNCSNVVIDQLSILNYISWWRSTLFGFQNVQNVFISNVKITSSNFYSMFDFQNVQNLIMQNVFISNNQITERTPYYPLNDIDQDNTIPQVERYTIQIQGNLYTLMNQVTLKSNKNLLFMRYSNTYMKQQEMMTLYNDQLILQNIYIEQSDISLNNNVTLQQMAIQPLIIIQSSNVSIFQMQYQLNQGNIKIISTAYLEVVKSTFKNNTSLEGGALYLQKINKFKLRNCTFSYNTAKGSGGGIYMDSINSFQIKENYIMYNFAEIGGGIRLINYNNQTFYSSQIMNNTAYIFGNNVGISPTQLNIISNKEMQYKNMSMHSIRYHLNPTNKDFIYISKFRSGELLPFKIQFLDQDNKILTFSKYKFQNQQYTQEVYDEINSLSIEIMSNDISKLLAIGQTNINYNQYNDQDKSFDILSLQIDSNPNQSHKLHLAISTNSNQQISEFNVNMEIHFRQCLIGEIKKRVSGDLIVCDQCTSGYYSLQDPEDQKTVQCQKCPIQAQECVGNKITLKDGYWRESQLSDQIFACEQTYDTVSCQENNPLSRKGCIQGYIGPLCQECDLASELWGSRYTFDSGKQICQRCDNLVIYYIYFIILTIVFFAYIILSVCLFMNNFIFHSTSTYLRFLQILPIYSSCIKDQSTFYMKSIINFLQLSSILLEPSFQKKTPSVITWPDNFGNPINNVFSFSNCLFFQRANTNYQITQAKIILEGFYPLIFLALSCLLFYTLAKYKILGIKTYHNYATLTILFTFFQPELVRFFTNALSCRRIGNQKYQTINLQIKCNEDSYLTFTYLFIIPYIILLLTLPLFFLVKIFQNRKKLSFCINKYKYGYFYLDYKDGFYFWEFIRIYMKTFIVLFYTLYKEQDIYYCYQIVSLFICLYAILNHVFRPYLQRKVFWLETSSMVILVICILLQQLNLMYNSITALSLLFGLYIIFILIVLIVIIYLKMININLIRLQCIKGFNKIKIPERFLKMIIQKNQTQIATLLRWKKIKKQMLVITQLQAFKTVQQCEASICTFQQNKVGQKRKNQPINFTPEINLNSVNKYKTSENKLFSSNKFNSQQNQINEGNLSIFNKSNLLLNLEKMQQSNTIFQKEQNSQHDKIQSQQTTNNIIHDEMLCFTINDLDNVSQYDEHTKNGSTIINPPELKQLDQIALKKIITSYHGQHTNEELTNF